MPSSIPPHGRKTSEKPAAAKPVIAPQGAEFGAPQPLTTPLFSELGGDNSWALTPTNAL